MNLKFVSIAFVICVLLNSCSSGLADSNIILKQQMLEKKTHDPISALFDPILADGFAYPFGNGSGGGNYTSLEDHQTYKGWYVATKTGEMYDLGIHTGEDWNGNGGGNTDFGQPVYATAKGIVIAAKDYGAPWGNVIYIKHCYVENAKLVTVYSLYAHLNEVMVSENDTVLKRAQIGTMGTGHNSFSAHLHFEIRKQSMKGFEVTYWPSSNNKDKKWVLDNYHKPSEFIDEHTEINLPKDADTLLIASKSSYKMHIYVKGEEIKVFDIALSQNPLGHKEIEGDNRMPEGEYYITEKNKGPFYGTYKDFFGPAWMRISYPNSFDAKAGLNKGIITKQMCEVIMNCNKKKQQPPKNSGLGGGIGIHGWAGEWPQNNRHLTWGCISFQNKELEKFYDLVPLKTKLYILP